jgi:hypothetical protein
VPEEMQGSFNRAARAQGQLDVVWEDVLSHPNEEEIPAVGGAAGAAAVVNFTTPPQSFFLNTRRFFIQRSKSDPSAQAVRGHWLVKHDLNGNTYGSNQASLGQIGVSPDLPDPLPDQNAIENRDYVKKSPHHYDVGEFWLRPRLEEAERRDYQFALRMQVRLINASVLEYATHCILVSGAAKQHARRCVAMHGSIISTHRQGGNDQYVPSGIHAEIRRKDRHVG